MRLCTALGATVAVALLFYAAVAHDSPRLTHHDSPLELENKSMADGCVLQQISQGGDVVPLLELETAITGCSSRNVSAKSQEVHAIRVAKVGPSTGTLPSVRLLVKPRLERSTHAGPLVLVLGSPGPVRWQLTTERLPNSSKIEAFVSSGSEVVTLPYILLDTTFKNLKFEELLASVESQYHVLTSYSLVQLASSVILKVGMDQTERATCNKSAGTTRMKHVESFVVLPQPIRTCTQQDANWNGSKIIYVVNLASSMGRESVVVQLVSRAGIHLEKHYVLVLKCQSQVMRWEIESAPGVQGTVEIMTEDSVTSEATSYLLSVIVRTFSLPHDRSSLLKHIQDAVGVPNSYIEAEGASRIQVLIDSGEAAKNLMWNEKIPPSMNLESMFPEWPAMPRKTTSVRHEETKLFKGKAHAEVRTHSGYAVETSASGKLPKDHQENGMSSKTSKKAVDTFTKEIIAKCTDERILAAIPVTAVNAVINETFNGSVPYLKTFPAHQYIHDVTLTLGDTKCIARQNTTHYLLEYLLTSCGGEVDELASPVAHLHQVQVWLLSHQQRSTALALARGTDKHYENDDEDAVEDGSGSTAVDGILGEHLLSVNVWCSQQNSSVYPITTNSSPDAKEEMFVPPSYQMDLYLDQEYTKHIAAAEFPVSVPVNSVIYSHLGIPNIPTFCIAIDECWLTNTTQVEDEHVHRWTILKNNCPAQIGVKIQHTDVGSSTSSLPTHMPCWKRFSFVLDEDFLGQSVYLSCQLDACISSSTQRSKLKCQSLGQQCGQQSLKLHLVQSSGKYSSLETLGPIRVLSQREMDAITGASPRRPPFLNPFAKQYVVEEKNRSAPQPPVTPLSTAATAQAYPGTVHQPGATPTRLSVVVVGVMVEAVVGIALSSFAIGVALVAAIWYIHSRTDPHRRRLGRYHATSTGPHPCSRPCGIPVMPHNLPVRVAMPLQPRI